MGPTSSTTFGSVCLESLGMVVEYVHDDPPPAKLETEDVPGGVEVVGVSRDQMEITLDCRAILDTWADFNSLVSSLGALIGTRASLTTRSHPSEPYDAYLTSVTTGERVGGTGIGEITMTFVVPDHSRTGDTSTVAIPSAGSATFTVSGTASPSLVISATAAVRDPESLVWGVRFDEGAFLHVKLPTSSETAATIDCSRRVVTVGGVTSMVTLDSDWPALSKGSHSVRMDKGTGAASMTLTERWA